MGRQALSKRDIYEGNLALAKHSGRNDAKIYEFPGKEYSMGRAWIEINAENLEKNVRAIKEYMPGDVEIMPAVKANAYGHGALPVSKELNRIGINHFCVACADEAVKLRKGGISGEILILGYTYPEQFALLRKYKLTQAVLDYDYACLIGSGRKKISCHIAIDSGMHRMGERAENLEKIEKIFEIPGLEIKGIFTHLCMDEKIQGRDLDVTNAQRDAFNSVLKHLDNKGLDYGKVHMLASYGAVNYSSFGGDYVRAGIAMYGVLSNRADEEGCPFELSPVLELKARIGIVKDLKKGEGVGYGHAFVAERDSRIAVVTIGYADGVPRELSCGKGSVLIGGKKAPIVGNICMDQMMVDVTDIENVKSGDVAVIIGRSGEQAATAYDLAEAAGTITNEILSRMGERLNRVVKVR